MMIELNETEQKLAKYLAKARHQKSRAKGVVNNRIGPQSDEFTDLEGIGGEIAFCKAMNIYPDMETGGYAAFDCKLPDGTRVDVKTTRYENGSLVSVPWKETQKVDVFALMIGQMPKYKFVGMMKAVDLLQEHRKKNLGHGMVYVAKQNELYR